MVNLSPWSAVVVANGMLNKAWVRIINIPKYKESMRMWHMFVPWWGSPLRWTKIPFTCLIFVGSCYDARTLTSYQAEGILGDYFYTFFYELESALINGEQYIASLVINTSTNVAPSAPSPKRPRSDNNTPSESSEGQTDNS
jgi:hypothetical protein